MIHWLTLTALADEGRPQVPPPEPDRPTVELVIALDVSGSMGNLLDSARMRLWEVVDLVSQADPQVDLRVGLIAYGDGDELVAELPLTGEIDAVSEQLMALGIQGGSEYVGAAIGSATVRMGWSDDDAVKLLFVCGNEKATQGSVAYTESAAMARREGIIVNAVFGGREVDGRRLQWADVAENGGGLYLAIDMAAGTVRIPEAPQDALLETLNAQLTETYVRIAGAADGKARMLEQDAQSRILGTSGTRLSTKGSAQYRNDTWDLIDGWEAGLVDLTDTEKLPTHLHDDDLEARVAYVEGLREHRRTVQARIREVAAERRTWIAAETARQNAATPSLDDAIRTAVKTQLEDRGLTF